MSPFFRIDNGPPTTEDYAAFARWKKETRAGRKKEAKASRSLALVLTAGIFRRQVFREIYGEVTAWIAMNSAHPPLSDLVIVQDLSAPQVLRA